MSQERRERRNEKLGIQDFDAELGAHRDLCRADRGRVRAGLLSLATAPQHKHDGFARCLTERGVKMYGAWWCPHCVEQKEKFGASFEYVPYVECGIKGDLHAQSQVCKDENIKHYPTWQFPPTGERVERVFTLQELSDRTGCPLP